MPTILEQLRDALLSWENVTARPGRFGAVAFYAGTREIGHIHGNDHVDLPFPSAVRHELVASGRAVPHYFLPNTGWATYQLRGEHAFEAALDLFRLNYELITKRHQFSETTEAG